MLMMNQHIFYHDDVDGDGGDGGDGGEGDDGGDGGDGAPGPVAGGEVLAVLHLRIGRHLHHLVEPGEENTRQIG